MLQRKNINRRQFLKRSTGIATGAIAFPYLVPSSALGKAGTVAPSNRVVMGCLGVGGMGQGDMRGFLNIEEVRVVAVCDVQEKKRQAAKGIVDEHYGNKDCALYNDFRKVIDRKDIDAVVIAPQDHWHAVMAVTAARAGKDMYCEKPLGVSVAECKAIRDTVRRHGRVFQTGTQQRSDRNFRFACELALNGYLGKIHTVKVAAPGPSYKRTYRKPTTEEPIPAGLDYDMYLGPAPKKPYNGGRVVKIDWYLIWDYSAGFIVNWGVHHLDIANWGCPEVAGEPCELTCRGSYRNDGLTDNINDWQAEFNYTSGLRMTYTDNKQNKQGVVFQGTEGWVHVNRSGIWAEPKSLLTSTIGPDEIRLTESRGHQRNFLDAVKTREETICPIDVAVRTDTICHLTDICTRLGRKLHWDPEKEDFVNDPQASRMLIRPMRSPWHL